MGGERGGAAGGAMNRDAAPASREMNRGETPRSDMDKGGAMNRNADSKTGAKETDRNAAETKDGAKDMNRNADTKSGTADTNRNAQTRDGANAPNTTGQAAAGAKLTTEQRTKVTTVIKQQNVQPVTNINFSISVGTRVPRDISFHPVPTEIITVYPAWRGYQFFLARGEIIIVDPATFEIVAVLPA
jgi:microcystin-dependent protein